MDDDGLVLIDGDLYKPEEVTKAAAKKFYKWDGADSRTVIKRYAANFPDPDLTTPSYSDFKLLMGRRKNAKRSIPAAPSDHGLRQAAVSAPPCPLAGTKAS